MKFQDGLVGFATGLVVGVVVFLGIIGSLSQRVFGELTTETVLFSAAAGLICGFLGIVLVYRFYQDWTTEYSLIIPYQHSAELRRFAIDAFAIKKFRCIESSDEWLVFAPVQPTKFLLNGILTPIASDANTISIHLNGGNATLKGPRIRSMLIDEIANQLTARAA